MTRLLGKTLFILCPFGVPLVTWVGFVLWIILLIKEGHGLMQ